MNRQAGEAASPGHGELVKALGLLIRIEMDADMSGGNAIESFMAVTGASKEVAAQHLAMARGNVDAAVAAFFDAADAGMEPTGGLEEEPGLPPRDAASSTATVDSILASVKESKGSGKGDSRDVGKGSGKGDDAPGNSIMIAIVFFADGFMVDDDPQPDKDPEPAPEETAAPVQRRTGMMGLSDLKPSRGRRGPRPKLPKLKPLRSYDTPDNQEFLKQVKAGKVPKEFQKRDESGRPVPVSIAIEDVRPKSYDELSKAIQEMEKEEEEEMGGSQAKPAPTLFTGAGHTLSSGSSSSATAGASVASGGVSHGGGSGADPALLSLVSAGAPVVDESKPATTLQLRLSTGARSRARLNLDHTVADVWRLVAAQMGLDAFRAASNHELAAGFPPKPLRDPSVTIKDADLANASVTHRSS